MSMNRQQVTAVSGEQQLETLIQTKTRRHILVNRTTRPIGTNTTNN